ncbi:glycoside hydrolase family 2 protein [Massiliimalia massiliensis]|uniref:glycoside hydrolase family 2 protein n=1 Tax=Massiliimalia massiliensis TaxID=1852384 RepID=UPI0009867298|nr:glycoside hydrolase family 2 [Massiliimalia massiliensis]
MEKTIIPRAEYPRPDFQREIWLNLNGTWNFTFDDKNCGEKERWYMHGTFEREILVPFCYQSQLSGINEQELHEVVWYCRKFQIPRQMEGKRIILHFGAVDYICRVWLNGSFLGEHQGGHTPFSFEITNFLTDEKNVLTVMAQDDCSLDKPRGKQYWGKEPERCWYTPTTGIWQTVWLEAVGKNYIHHMRITPDIDRRIAILEVFLDQEPNEKLELTALVSYHEKTCRVINTKVYEKYIRLILDIREEDPVDEVHYWSPEEPNLYDLCLMLSIDGAEVDKVSSYFGMRKIEAKNGMILLNNKPYIQKMVLDQGYWPESLITPPSDEAILLDLEMTKKFGFNGARKHQKIEDPRYYYWADRLGVLVWGEMPSGYQFNTNEIVRLTTEWMEFLERDYNHPCIVCWVPFNESWGIRNVFQDEQQQALARSLYELAKAYDPIRLVSTQDGWEQICPSDICGIHDYTANVEEILNKYKSQETIMKSHAQGRILYSENNQYGKQPVLITEYGGIAFSGTSDKEWGYFGTVEDEEEFFKRYEEETLAFWKNDYVWGYAYTQLTDVEQEVNGLMTADRQCKVDSDRIKWINDLCNR